MSDSEAIERLKAIHRKQHIARVADDTKDARKPSRVWGEKLGCAWCGKPFNQADEGTLRDYCCRECKRANATSCAQKRDEANREKRRQAGSRRYAKAAPKKGTGK
jgi:endogenous inhibitor of DNA gyrase (YacG/DUF329 family)